MSARPETIEVPVWWSNGGGMMIRRECLPFDHPEHPYHYVQRTYGVDPLDYGIEAPQCPCCDGTGVKVRSQGDDRG